MNAINPTRDFAVDPVEIVNAGIRRDLLTECIEILIAELGPLLTAIWLDDDELIIAQFRRVDLAFRTARQCAVEIRDGGAA